jgi:hypothetical protein
MKIYRAAYIDGQHGTLLSWHGSRRAAEQALREQAIEMDNNDPTTSVYVHNIPGTKAGFLVWLNTNFTTDNG